MQTDSIESIIADIKVGKMVIIMDDEDRENEGDFIMAAEKATSDDLAFIIRHSSGLICTPMTAERLDKLQLPLMWPHNTDHFHTAFTISVDYNEGTTTGISAYDRALTSRSLADPSSKPNDFTRPGHIFPLRAHNGGVLTRPGHTEAAVDLATLAGLSPVGLICEIVNDDGTMKRGQELFDFAREHTLKIGTIADLIRYRKD